MAVLYFGGILVECCLRASVVGKEFIECLEVIKEIGICKMAPLEVLQKGGQTSGRRKRKQG